MEHPIYLSLQEAITLALSKAKTIGSEHVPFSQAKGRVLAQDVYSDINMPPFNKSMMDGYACKREDLGKELDVLEIIPAGKSPQHELTSGQCAKIMTGAQVPKGADTVFIVEESEEYPGNKVHFTGTKTNSNISLSGEDLKAGDPVLAAGTLLKAQHLAMLAAVGCTSPKVSIQPKVGIISTGSELVEPERIPQNSQIRNSNGHQLMAQVLDCNCLPSYYGIVEDDRQSTLQIIQKSTEENEVTLISGGVSVGDFDYVPEIIKQLGFEILLNKLTVKPGKHTTFAVKENKYIIGFPGNPVSSFIQFELFAKPFLYKLMACEYKNQPVPLKLAEDFQRKHADREEFVPVVINNQQEVELVSYNGSAHIHAYHQASGFMNIPNGIKQIAKGEIVLMNLL